MCLEKTHTVIKRVGCLISEYSSVEGADRYIRMYAQRLGDGGWSRTSFF